MNLDGDEISDPKSHYGTPEFLISLKLSNSDGDEISELRSLYGSPLFLTYIKAPAFPVFLKGLMYVIYLVLYSYFSHLKLMTKERITSKKVSREASGEVGMHFLFLCWTPLHV
jgi:hypothetical protein